MPNTKAYPRVNWASYPSKTTPITAANLNVMDKGIDDIDDRVVSVLNRLDTDESNITSQGSAIAALENEIDDMFVTLTETLTAGQTTLTFTDSSIVATSLVKLFSAEELDYESATSSVGSVTFTFEAQASDVSFTLLVMNL